jgi:hypothetical protein
MDDIPAEILFLLRFRPVFSISGHQPSRSTQTAATLNPNPVNGEFAGG